MPKEVNGRILMGKKEVEVMRMTDKIKNKCYIDIRGVYTTN